MAKEEHTKTASRIDLPMILRASRPDITATSTVALTWLGTSAAAPFDDVDDDVDGSNEVRMATASSTALARRSKAERTGGKETGVSCEGGDVEDEVVLEGVLLSSFSSASTTSTVAPLCDDDDVDVDVVEVEVEGDDDGDDAAVGGATMTSAAATGEACTTRASRDSAER